MQKIEDLLVEYNICLADVPCLRHEMARLLSCLRFKSNCTHCTQSTIHPQSKHLVMMDITIDTIHTLKLKVLGKGL